MQPYPYQQTGLDEIIKKFETVNSVIYQLNTGGGKTVIFSFLIKWWLQSHPTNVLVLCHRTELIKQTEKTLSKIGIGSEPIVSKVKNAKHHSRVYIGMIETASRRLQRNPYFFKNIGLIVTDEAHILVFHKVFSFFPKAKILGCTATPCVMKRITFYKCPFCKRSEPELAECCGEEMQEWSRPFTLSEIYEDIVVGPTIDEIIEYGSIVKEITFIKNYTETEGLKKDSDGEFTVESVDQAYTTDSAVFNVFLNYKELCTGKKTIVFNSSSKTNLAVYERFISEGLTNVRMYDSVNKIQSGNREDVLEWFDKTPDAILMNVGVFTTGFDSREVECIILNRPTGSLSLFLQITGRGARASEIIYKDNFILIDGGGNVDRFGEWSQERDWRTIFFEGTSREKCKVMNAMDIQDCPECGSLYPKSEPICPECGHEIESSDKPIATLKESEEVLVPIREIPPPNGERIYKYTISQNQDINFAFKIMIGQIRDMFRYYRVTVDKYESAKSSGELDKKIAKMVQKCYFVLLKKDDIQTTGNRTLSNLIERTKKQLEQYYYA
jgi:superfamily II DNA or RNA helicase